MPAADFIKEICAKDLKKVEVRLKKEKAAQSYSDPAVKGKFYSLLHKAVEVGSTGIVDALLKAGADVNAVDSEGDTVMHWLGRTNDKSAEQILDLLLRRKPTPKLAATNKKNETALHVAASLGNDVTAGALAKVDAELAKNTSPGCTPLHLAAKNGKVAAIQSIAKAGGSLSVQDDNGYTPLMLLIREGHSTAALDVLQCGDCGLAAQDTESGESALALVCHQEEPNLDLVRALLAAGASPDVQSGADKDTLIIAAVRARRLELAMALIGHSSKANQKNKSGESALSLAVMAGLDDLAAVLLQKGGDIGAEGSSMLKAAVEGKKDALAASLIKVMKPTAIDALEISFRSLATSGCVNSAIAYIRRFEEDQSDKLSSDDEGNTYLHVVAQAGCSPLLVDGLVSMGLTPNALNKEGDTPLHVAARRGHVEVCKALVAAGADPMIRNKKNKKPRDQIKIPDCTKAYLLDAEEEAKERKSIKSSNVWDEKMKSTQTESAFGVRVC